MLYDNHVAILLSFAHLRRDYAPLVSRIIAHVCIGTDSFASVACTRLPKCCRCSPRRLAVARLTFSFSFRGIELEALLDKSQKELLQLLTCRIRRRFARGIPRAYNTLLKKLRKAKKATAPHDKPATVKTHLRNMPIIPEMIGSVVGVYNGQFFVNVEIKVGSILLSSLNRFVLACLDVQPC